MATEIMDQAAATERWDRNAALWNQTVGDEGDGMRRTCSDVVLWEMIHDALARVPESARVRVLDAGCGNGYLVIQLYERLHARWPNVEVVGIDAARAMVEYAQERVARHVEASGSSSAMRVLHGSISELSVCDGIDQARASATHTHMY